MSSYSNKAGIALYKMINNMNNEGIELSRITKCSTQLIMAGFSPNSIPDSILNKCLMAQNNDGGWVSVVDTIWNTKFLSFYKKTEKSILGALKFLNDNRVEYGFGRSKRDIGRIPVTGIAFYLLPQLATDFSLRWLMDLWISEKNGLTYKAAYTLMAFKTNNYTSKNQTLILDIIDWLTSQQEADGGFSPWKGHPVGSNIYCTSVALVGMINYINEYPQVKPFVDNAYKYICNNQLVNGLWAYHELEDGGAWGLVALSAYESEFMYE